MWTAVGQSLLIAVGLVLATLPVVLVTLLLATMRPPSVTRGFLGGWMLGLAVVGGGVVALVDIGQPDGPPPRW
ncbi:MAG TPA: hypothetical protein VFH03_17860, partial [Actinoplanes sp.]|nr:hypothetical protein [Actinoplanes sp.]